ncbi:MAG: hypothetical protein US36_C0020G0010 [Candidatus Wolfebacteria bacterium GW2011_GWC1_37_10]|uniref:Type II restriction endonuclease n=1 Tax=Candidatus Wolfebacteria bacterium GW2011_GWC1_37_10 TaxID=1619010 RepID=A0A0G0FU73_9BACT|nr:MAG: hypothetical protein US36_C0020G0010 [Candidatus Wolfebacteria bacterium GW2011_GWC1_37_10]
MNIKDVKTAIKVGDFVLKKDHRNKIDIKYLPHPSNKVLTDSSARIYLIVQDGVIKKIGGSASKGGIRATMIFYISAMTGSPGVPRFVVHLLIEKALHNKSKVELFMITSPRTLAKVSGLFGYKKVEIASFKEMEDLCKSDYYSREKRYPDWNFQENHEAYPSELARKHNLYHRKRLNKK